MGRNVISVDCTKIIQIISSRPPATRRNVVNLQIHRNLVDDDNGGGGGSGCDGRKRNGRQNINQDHYRPVTIICR